MFGFGRSKHQAASQLPVTKDTSANELLTRLKRANELNNARETSFLLTELYVRYGQLFQKVALDQDKTRTLLTYEDAQDIVHETFKTIILKIGTYRERNGGSVSWMKTICRNLATDEIRKRTRRQTASMNGLAESTPVSDIFTGKIEDEGPVKGVEDEEIYRALIKALEEIPEADLMEIIEIGRGTGKGRTAYHEAATRVRSIFEKHYGPIEDK